MEYTETVQLQWEAGEISLSEDVLRASADIIADRGWCQGAAARDVHGFEIWPLAREAVCWCPHGAISWAVYELVPLYPRKRIRVRELAMLRLRKFLGIASGEIPEWNDAPERQKSEVLSALRNAAAVPWQGLQRGRREERR